MSNLDKAREWANSVGIFHPDAQAAIKLIQSLPDQWVDAEKLERIIAGMDCCLTQGSETNFSDGFKEATTTWRDALKALLPPKLPTLADMTREERDECKWAQADMEQHGRGFITCILDDSVQFMKDNGLLITVWEKDYGKVTPLPDLPKLEWPGSAPDDVAYATGGVLTTQDVVDECRAVRKERAVPRPEGCCGKCPETADGGYDCTCEDNPRCSKNTPNPEDVPPNEPWLIEFPGGKAIGTRYAGDSFAPWSVAALDGSHAGDYLDDAVTLIHKLVAEPPALPEGMRLADHEKYGRVVVSPNPDVGNDYRVFYSYDNTETGSSWGYAHESKLTFLDGDQ